MSVEEVRCKDCIYYEGLAECKIIENCGGTDFYCAYGKTAEMRSETEWDGKEHDKIIKKYLCYFCRGRSIFVNARSMEHKAFAELLKSELLNSSISNISFPATLSVVASNTNGIDFIFLNEDKIISLSWNMAARYIKEWADAGTVEVGSTMLNYELERISRNAGTSVRENIKKLARDFNATERQIEKAQDYWGCSLKYLSKDHFDEYIAQTKGTE